LLLRASVAALPALRLAVLTTAAALTAARCPTAVAALARLLRAVRPTTAREAWVAAGPRRRVAGTALPARLTGVSTRTTLRWLARRWADVSAGTARWLAR
jgi:hypothetical protein